MKTVKFAKKWRCALSETSYEEYPAGSTVQFADKKAAKAFAAGVLDGEPVEATTAETPPA